MTNINLDLHTDSDLSLLAEGTRLRSKVDITDGDEHGLDRITPPGAIWRTVGTFGTDGDYEIVCDENGAWVYTLASNLRDNFEILPDLFHQQIGLAVSHLGSDTAISAMLYALHCLANEQHPTVPTATATPVPVVESIDTRTARAKDVIALYGLMNGSDVDVQTSLSDLLCDLMHAAVIDDDDFLHALETATDNYLAECHELVAS